MCCPPSESTSNFPLLGPDRSLTRRFAFIIRQAVFSAAAIYKRLHMPKTTGHGDREKYLVARLAKKIPSIGSFGNRAVPFGIGDDSAVLRPSGQSEFVVSCDFSLEGVHFRGATHPAVSIGYRCLVRAASDIVAMGACPRYFLVALALPAEKTPPAAKGANWLDSFSSGMGRAARELGMLLIGGDITVNQSVSICITVIGELPAGLAISRAGARPGHLIYVTGTLGAAQLGLEILLRGSTRKPAPAKLLQPHLYPRIPVGFAQAVARRRIPSAMMDISDGLSTDLSRMCESSRTGARLFAAQIPQVDAHRPALDPLQLALHGGEDYSLLFTAPPKHAPLLRAIAAKTKTRITHIGEITRSRKILLVDSNGHESPLEPRGWDPFRVKNQ